MKQPAEHEALFRDWLGKYSGLIFKIGRSFTFEEEDRKDLTQEILVQVWRSIPRYEPKAKVSTWLYRVALNTALAWRRKEKKHAWRIAPIDLENLREPQMDSSLASDGELVNALYSSIRKLAKLDGCLITMFLDDLNYREMAEVLGVSENNAGVMLHRAKKNLTRLMMEVSHECR